MERLMFGSDFEFDAWPRFWRWNLIKIYFWTRDKNSTLGSVVPLAMFKLQTTLRVSEGRVRELVAAGRAREALLLSIRWGLLLFHLCLLLLLPFPLYFLHLLLFYEDIFNLGGMFSKKSMSELMITGRNGKRRREESWESTRYIDVYVMMTCKEYLP